MTQQDHADEIKDDARNMQSTACDLETAGLDTKALCVSVESYLLILFSHYFFWLWLGCRVVGSFCGTL